ncbi:Metal transporter CNNM2 [Hondaea fermentalgiana]|uniref:Metal transporter CNNM2 n=1 Tax=Hondaea fermentalgiana TaxID=2315210 RepID=A0A2R5GWW1_9STRA|nr:Metal transporter CNNM2 [Hondaea fermentalgiana]|eukprot:GBG33163.1 Metal transporter CNNM2 [Hondaea fermentalgiana]
MEDNVGLEPVGSWEFFVNAGLALGCVCLAALAAGLTMGLVAIEPFRLQILLETKEEHCTSRRQRQELRDEQKAARSILPVVSRHHLLLVTLLLLNSLANECLPLFLDEIVPSWIAIILSVTLVLLCGEIIPSAIFTGPNQLFVAARFVPLVKGVMLLLWPIAYPISRILDYCLGEEHEDKFNKAELRALVKLHAQNRNPRTRKPSRSDAQRDRARSQNSDPNAAAAAMAASLVQSDDGRPRLGSRVSSAEIRTKLTELGVDERTASMAAMATAAAQQAIDEEESDFWNNDPGHGETMNAAIGVMHAASSSANIDVEDQPTPPRSPLSHAGSMATAHTEGGLEVDEILIMNGALDLKETTAEDIMIPLMHVYMLSTEDSLTMSKLADLVAQGHSRIPVYDKDRTNIRGLLLVKKLIVVDPNDSRRVDTLFLRMPIFVKPDTTLLVLLNEFQKGHSHMAIVTDQPDIMEKNLRADEPIDDSVHVFGICTLEDIMEALIREDISDETDYAVSVKQALFTQQRIQRLRQLALNQKKQRKLALSGVAALMGAKSRNKTANASYGAVRTGSSIQHRSSAGASSSTGGSFSYSNPPPVSAEASHRTPLLHPSDSTEDQNL